MSFNIPNVDKGLALEKDLAIFVGLFINRVELGTLNLGVFRERANAIQVVLLCLVGSALNNDGRSLYLRVGLRGDLLKMIRNSSNILNREMRSIGNRRH